MTTRFTCPDCRCIHEEPLDAAYLLQVRCASCELERERAGHDVDHRESYLEAA